MSLQHPIISVTGSSGAGTTSVRNVFEQIFRRERISAAFIEGDAYHRYGREAMRAQAREEALRGNHHFGRFAPEANLLEELQATFSEYPRSGGGRSRHYVHDAREQAYRLTPEARAALSRYIALRRRLPHFADARSIRNALDRARLRQANRLVGDAGGDAVPLSAEDLGNIEAADILDSRVFREAVSG